MELHAIHQGLVSVHHLKMNQRASPCDDGHGDDNDYRNTAGYIALVDDRQGDDSEGDVVLTL